ncbi:MAG: aminoglycoside 6-adenylyltransferase [Dehalococcoidia bacterium]
MVEEESDPVLRRAVAWASGNEHVRALILESSRAAPDAPVDALSDYDLLLVVTTIEPLRRDESWLAWYGAPLVRFRSEWNDQGYDGITRLVVYEDGTKVDHLLMEAALLDRIKQQPRLPNLLDVGYRVLLDKDGLADGLKPATYRAHIPSKPTEAEYLAVVEEFWWESTYVAKNIWRDELFAWKYNLECVMKLDVMRRMLEWHVEIAHDWSVRPGVVGRHLKRRLPPDIWAEVEATFVGADADENWEALFRTGAVFRRVALEVAAGLGYRYPHKMDAGVVAYWQRLRTMPH